LPGCDFSVGPWANNNVEIRKKKEIEIEILFVMIG
jgi:hypothetical protein